MPRMTTVVALLLVVRVFDRSGESLQDRKAAVRAADAILRQAEVTTRWIDCSPTATASSACAAELGPGELAVRITPAPPTERRDAATRPLGYSLVDIGARKGTLGTVFSDRVAWLADAAQTGRDVLLGRAIAHEIGHLLLGTNNHPGKGLMRAVWTVDDLQRDRPDDWLFTSGDAARLRRSRFADDGTRMAGGGAPDAPDNLLTLTLDDPS
jgi:hypothetical protein